jgi:cobalt-zinc-cadmium efflux system membrane fusion protein
MIDVPPENRAVVSAIMGGYIKTTPLLIGDYVKKGQSLVTIENPEFVTLQQDYMQIRQQLNYLQSEYERQKTMVAENITSQKNFLKSESEFKTATAKLNGLRKQLTMLNIPPSDVENGTITSVITLYAPIAGSITKIYVNKGTYVSPASPILEIVDNDHIHLELSVFEKDILKLRKEQKIRFKIPEASSEIYEGEVHLIGTSIDENRTIKVHGHPTNDKNHNFLTGMFVDASIIIDTASAKALPSEAIVTIDDTSYGLLLDSEDDKNRYFKQVILQVGTTADGYTEIKNFEAFKPSDRFLIKGAFNLMGE